MKINYKRASLFCVVLLLVTLWSVNAQVAIDLKDYAIDTIAIGDINHDKIPDFALVKGTRFSNESNDWEDCAKT